MTTHPIRHSRHLFALAGCLLLVSAGLMARPAYPGWQQRTLSDGTPVSLRLTGDEFYHYWTTTDGKIALEQTDGTFVITGEDVPTPQKAAERRRASALYPTKPRKAIGDRNFAPRGLVILVQFQDVKFYSQNDSAAFYALLNKEGYNYGRATGSAADYFNAQSNGEYKPVFDVFGPVTLPHNRKYYGEQGKLHPTDEREENDMYLADFVIDAVLAADEDGCDFSLYDSDNDEMVDIVYFFYAGKGQASGGSTETIWPHNWNLFSALYLGFTHGTSEYYATWGDYNLPVLDGKYIYNYACSEELKYDNSRTGIGAICHEFSHVLGLPDYYDTGYGTNSEDHVTPGAWSLMDAGCYNNDEKTPPNYSAYDKFFMGWTTPAFLAKNEEREVTISTDYHDSYQITGGKFAVDYNHSGVVYYLENRQRKGWDLYLPGHGMLIWKVNYDAGSWYSNSPNNTPGEPRYTLISAGGGTVIGDVFDYNTGKYTHQGASDPFPGNKMVRSYTPAIGCKISDIKELNDNIVFQFNSTSSEEPDKLDTLTCQQAADLCSALEDNTPTEETFTVIGYVTKMVSDGVVDGQQRFWMDDMPYGGQVFRCYMGNVPEEVFVGDKVALSGHLSLSISTPEIRYGTVNILSRASSADNIVQADSFDADAPYEVYTLQGTRVSTSTGNLQPGAYILRQGKQTMKIIR